MPTGVNSFKMFMAYRDVFMIRDDEVCSLGLFHFSPTPLPFLFSSLAPSLVPRSFVGEMLFLMNGLSVRLPAPTLHIL